MAFGIRRCGGGSELSERAPSFMVLEQIQAGLAKTGLSKLAAHTCSAETFKMLAVSLLDDLPALSASSPNARFFYFLVWLLRCSVAGYASHLDLNSSGPGAEPL